MAVNRCVGIVDFDAKDNPCGWSRDVMMDLIGFVDGSDGDGMGRSAMLESRGPKPKSEYSRPS